MLITRGDKIHRRVTIALAAMRLFGTTLLVIATT